MVIVIVDDSPTNLIVLKQLAKCDGAEVLTFSRPAEAMRYLELNSVDLVVVDCEMPEMDGLDFTARLRRTVLHRSTSVLMISQHAAVDIGDRAIAAGVDEIIHRGAGSQIIKAGISACARRSRVTMPELTEAATS